MSVVVVIVIISVASRIGNWESRMKLGMEKEGRRWKGMEKGETYSVSLIIPYFPH